MSESTARELKALCLREPAKALTLAVAESLTGGCVQSRITAISGASGFFLGGITAYTIDQKVKHLGVNRAVAKKVDAVSAEIAEQMARGAVKLFGADIAVATTGYAEPTANPAHEKSGEVGVEVLVKSGAGEPFAFWAIAHRRGPRSWKVVTGRVVCPGMTRTQTQDCVADTVLAELVAYLRSVP